MAQHYSDPSREDETYALPDLEVWQEDAIDCPHCDATQPISMFYDVGTCRDCEKPLLKYAMNIRGAWWWWSCFPGCLPDSDAMGPFETEAEALEDARG